MSARTQIRSTLVALTCLMVVPGQTPSSGESPAAQPPAQEAGKAEGTGRACNEDQGESLRLRRGVLYPLPQ